MDISENKQLIEKQKAEVNIQAKFLEELQQKMELITILNTVLEIRG